MATSDRKKSRSTTRKKAKARQQSSTALVPRQRKQEVLGLIMMVVALLVALALITYSPADDYLTFSLDALLNPSGNRAQNALGLIGASLARTLVPGFLGYTALLFPGLLFAWGYLLFRNRTPVFLPLITGLTSVGAFILACLFGWFGLVLAADMLLWSGTWGSGTAAWLDRVFGTVGSFILLLLVLAVTMLLLIDHDIQRSLDRAEELLKALRRRLSGAWADLQGRRAERRAEQARLRQERRSELALAREERLQERAARSNTPSTPRRTTATPPPSRTQQHTGPVRAVSSTAQPPPSPPPAPPPPRPQPPPATPPTTTPAASAAEAGEATPLELKVQARVEEEKTDVLAHADDAVPKDLPFEMPPLDLLDAADADEQHIDFEELEENKQVLLDALATYNIEITDINAIVGPTVTLYELTPAPGIKISRITALEDDLAMAMAARGIRMIAPIPGKSAIGVEIPNRHRELVRIRDTIGTARFRDANMELPLIVGKTIEGEVFLRDLVKMPHLLIAGATGSGKSVGLNTFIAGLLYACHPANLKLVMIDPKKIELQPYARIMDHYLAMPPEAEEPIITDVSRALGTLKSCEKEMEARYDLLSKARVRGIKDYNKKFHQGALAADEDHRHLPYIVVIVDELADLMMTAGKEIEGPIARLAQMARAVGIHLILATQRPSVDVITGLIKANFPARVAYQVASKIDSRTILDQNGAQGLVGNGDLLYMLGSHILRLQGPFVSIEEVDALTFFISEQPGYGPYLLPPIEEGEGMDGRTGALSTNERDDLFDEAARIIVRSQQGSVSLLQRKLSVGYSRAARIIDQLEDAGIVGPFEGSKARQVLVADEFDLDDLLKAKA